MDLLTNGIESIQVGIEDFEKGTRPRLLSSVRNIHAGILLLYKEALRHHSPPNSEEALLKAKVVPSRDRDGNVTFVGHGTKTVDIWQIKEHFDRLGISTDWDRFGRINTIRNEIEHYYTTVSQETLEAVIADTFVIVRNFVTSELQGDPRELLGESIWQSMLKVSDVLRAMVAQFGLSERRASGLMELWRSTYRRRSQRPAESPLRERLRTLAGEWPRFGYRRLHVLLQREGWVVNHKRIHRLYREEGLAVRRRRRKRVAGLRAPLLHPTRANERWSMDFLTDALGSGRNFRVLTIVDDRTRECLALEADTSVPGSRVV